MSVDPAHPSPQHEQQEAHDTLLAMAKRKTGRIPAGLLASHLLDIYRDAGWPVQRAAMEALLRRFEFARRDGLRPTQRPGRGRVLGLYRTRARDGETRPYKTVLRSLLPLVGSCDCPDFLRSSLGACKHLLAVLDALAAQPRQFERALEAGQSVRGRAIRLTWDPIRPLHGRGDWLEQVRLETTGGGSQRQAAGLEQARRHFVSKDEDRGRIERTWPDHPEKRLALVTDLLEPLDASARSIGADPALRALLLREQKRLEALVQSRRGRRPSLHGLRRKLYPYQREGVVRLLDRERLLLADDMGLGKTIQAAAACHALYRAGRVRRGLVITPASLKSQWEREWSETTNVLVSVVEGPPSERARFYQRSASGFLITNYEQVLRDLDRILEWDPDMVVLDEAQRIKNWATKTAAFVKRLKPRFRLVLTGTPLENRLEELASIMEWVDDHALEPKWRLVPLHSVFADGPRETVGARHLDTLRERLAPHMLRRLRSDVLAQLPPRTDTPIPVEMSEAQREEHDALDSPIASLYHRARKRPLTQAEFLQLMSLLTSKRIIANGLAQHRFSEVWPGIERARPHEALLASLSSPKLGEVRALLAAIAIEQGRKVVVFSQWRKMLRLAHWAVADLLSGAGLRACFFTGQEGSRQRTRNLVDFHDDPAARVLFATDAGGVGLNLQRAASACILLDLPWNRAVLEQRVARIYRIGQKRPIDVYSLVSRGSIEEHIASLVADKQALFRGLFDGKSDSVRFDRSGSFLTSLEKLVGGELAAVEAAADAGETEADEEIGEQALQAWLREGEGEIEGADDGEGAGASDGSGRGLGPEGSDGPEAETAGGVRQGAEARDLASLLAGVAIERTESGGLRIEAAPEASDVLAALFTQLADALRGAGDSPRTS